MIYLHAFQTLLAIEPGIVTSEVLRENPDFWSTPTGVILIFCGVAAALFLGYLAKLFWEVMQMDFDFQAPDGMKL